MIDVDALVTPLGEESPCGENLEYDPEYMALEVAARGGGDAEFGDTRIEAEEPDWKSIEGSAVALLSRTRDLRPAMILVRALTRNDGIQGLAQGLDLVARLVDELWEQVHPQLDPDDEYDPIMRTNALAALVDSGGLLRDVRDAQFLQIPGFGACSVRDVEIALGLLEAPESGAAFTQTQIEGMLGQAGENGVPNHAQLSIDHLRKLKASLDERVGSAESLDPRPLIDRLMPLARLYANATSTGEQPEGEQPGEPGTGQAAARGQAVGELRTREDAIRALDRVCDYIERNEPTNPAPLLIRRAQRLMTMSFVDIMREMAPEGMDSISKIAGLDAGGE